jgi:rhodanese-related sulfurtransferase
MQAQKLIAEKKVIVLDLRTPNEFRTGRIAGATNIDFTAADFEARIDRLDTNKTYLVHCASGGRSTHSLPVFQKHHFNAIYHLDGGIKGWAKAGLPLEK